MNRRAFVESTLGLAAVLASTRPAMPSALGAWATETGDLVVYDRRFPAALGLARSLSSGIEPLPVAGDVTELAAQMLSRAGASRALTLCGVTTESVPFCLHQLARPTHRTALECQRMNRDLFAWNLTLWRR